MTNVVAFKPKPICTNIHTTCTHEGCPLKKLFAQLGVGNYLGNCSGYRPERAAQQHREQHDG